MKILVYKRLLVYNYGIETDPVNRKHQMADDKLLKRIGTWGVFSIASGAMISSGLFVLPGLAFAKSGPAVILAYAIAGVLIIPAMLAQAELATAMPRAGGNLLFHRTQFGASGRYYRRTAELVLCGTEGGFCPGGHRCGGGAADTGPDRGQ